MKRLYIRIKSNFEKDIFWFKESNYDFVLLHLGTNSIFLSIALFVCMIFSLNADVLKWSYLKGINGDLSFFIGLFSIVMGVGFYHFWKMGEKSVYTLHFTKTKFMPKGVNVIFDYKDFTFAVSRKIKIKTSELPAVIRELFCIAIFLNLALITLDNSGFDILKKFPAEALESKTKFCPDKDDTLEKEKPKPGCELIIRAFKLGYAKDLGVCEPKKIDPTKLEICEDRRKDEPYLHYMSRVLYGSVKSKVDYFDNDRVKKIEDRFNLQLQELEVLKDYQKYAISASPRASHHIWTNLPYPENIFVEKYRKFFNPGFCIEQFQNQTNTVKLKDDDERKNSKLLEHVYGQLLFNPKSRITVGFCKEFNIHWGSEYNTCEKLAENPRAVLLKQGVLSDVELVLKRHDIANTILTLDEKIKKIEKVDEDEDKPVVALNDKLYKVVPSKDKKTNKKYGKQSKNKIVKAKIAKDKQQLRKKNELVSFQCFMQANEFGNRNIKSNVKLDDTNFLVRTRYFPKVENKGESQISMYKEFSKIMEDRFLYSKFSSRSAINVESTLGGGSGKTRLLEEPSYLFTRLEKLKNVDIFLGDNWVLEREDLLDIYPYHVHLQNYVTSFRKEYQESRGRL